MTGEIFCLPLKQDQKQDKKLEVQLFLMCLLVPLALADLLPFCLVFEVLALGLIVGLAIGGAEKISRKLAVGLLRLLQWKVLMSLQRCSIAKTGSQVFSSLG